MRRSFLALASFAFFGSLLLAGDASACCHKKTRCAPVCAPAPVVCAPVVCVPAPVCAPKKKCGGMKLFSHMHHKKAVCAPACVVVEAAPVQWVAPSAQSVAPSGQGY